MPVAFRPTKFAIGSTARTKYSAADLKRQLEGLEKNISAFAKHMTDQSPAILKEALEPTFMLANVLCPKETNRLVNSGYLEVEKTAKGAKVAMGYAYRGNPPYAVYVHEIPNKHKAPTTWKWLQTAIQSDASRIQARLELAFKTASGTGGK